MSDTGAVRVTRVRKLGLAYKSRSGHAWQWYALLMSDGTERHTSVPAGHRAAAAARRNVTPARRDPDGAGHWHRPDLPRVHDAVPCPDGRCQS
jgi:hypothetical protein